MSGTVVATGDLSEGKDRRTQDDDTLTCDDDDVISRRRHHAPRSLSPSSSSDK